MSNKLQTIGDVFTVSSGGTPLRDKPEYYINGNIPWIKTGDLKGKYVNNPDEFITEEALKNSSAKLFPERTVLLAMYGATIGACSILPFEASINQACAALLPTDKCDEVYLYYFLKSILGLLVKMGVGGAQPNISGGKIKQILIPLPSLPVQKKIAAILDAADLYHRQTKTLIEKYGQLAQSLFLEMFGDPVRNEKGWEKLESNKLCFFKKESIIPQNIITGTKYVGLECIEKETGNKLDISEVTEGDLKSNKFTFDENYILYGKLRPYLNKVALPNFKGICSTDIIPIKPIKGKSNRQFICQIMRGKGFVSFAHERSSGANLPRISPSVIEKYLVINPPLSLQTQFADRIQLIELQKAQAQAALQKSEALFNSLLQKAFKGELVAE